VLSGLLWQGAPRRLMDLGRDQKVILITSLALLAELAEVLGRDKFAVRIRQAKLSAKGLVEDYAGIAHVIEAPALLQPVSRDPDDDQVLACALAAQVDAIVSGDDDLLSLGSFQDIAILTAAQVLEKLKTA
jgi:putative PIN family toxin of toxin-antitoxin system